MIDPETGWFKIIQYHDKQAATISNLVEQNWLFRYPKPKIILYNHGNRFLSRSLENNLMKNK